MDRGHGCRMARFASALRQLERELPAFPPLGREGGSLIFCSNELSGEPDFEYAMIDGTIVRVHQQGTGAAWASTAR